MKHYIIKLNLIFLVSLTLFASSCEGSKSVKQESNGWANLTEEQRDFWTKFDNDLYFQKEHTKQPLALEIIEIDEKPRTEFLDSSNFSNDKPIWLYGNATEATEFFHEYKNDSTFLTIEKGIETGIHATYEFKRNDGKWSLVRIIDESN